MLGSVCVHSRLHKTCVRLLYYVKSSVNTAQGMQKTNHSGIEADNFLCDNEQLSVDEAGGFYLIMNK